MMGSWPRYLDQIVNAALGSHIQSCNMPSNGRVADTFVLSIDGVPGNVVCKIGGESVRTGEVIEPLVVREVGSTPDIPVASVVASGQLKQPSETERRWALYEHLHGEPPCPFATLDLTFRRQILHQVGKMLGLLHVNHPAPGIGPLGRTNNRLCIRPSASTILSTLLEPNPTSVSIDSQPVLAHGDLFPANLLVDDQGTITGVVDWGDAHCTLPGYALARAELRFIDWFRPTPDERRILCESLRSGYREHRSLPSELSRLGPVYKAMFLCCSGARQIGHLTSSHGRRQLGRHLRSLY